MAVLLKGFRLGIVVTLCIGYMVDAKILRFPFLVAGISLKALAD